MNKEDIKILIVEDEALIAEDIFEICNSAGYTSCEQAYNAGQALLKIENSNPDLILLDINISDDIDGIEIAEKLESDLKIPYLFISSYSDENTLSRVQNLNPSGYIVKPFNRQQLITSLNIALNKIFAQTEKLPLKEGLEKLGIKLTQRELDIIELILEGKKIKEVSNSVFLSENTVKYHLKNIYQKAEVHTRAELFSRLKDLL